MSPATRDRLIAAAFDLFETRGYDATSVDQIATRAGVGRTTFFRTFGSKDDVVLPLHDEVLREVDARLATASPTTRSTALREAARIVFDHYLAEGDVARRRYRLTSAVPALREREMSSVKRYQRLFSQHITRWLGDDPDGLLRAELIAAAVITGHNHVLRAWLRGDPADLVDEFEHAMNVALQSLSRPASGRTTVVVTLDDDVEAVLRDVREALEHAR